MGGCTGLQLMSVAEGLCNPGVRGLCVPTRSLMSLRSSAERSPFFWMDLAWAASLPSVRVGRSLSSHRLRRRLRYPWRCGLLWKYSSIRAMLSSLVHFLFLGLAWVLLGWEVPSTGAVSDECVASSS